MVKTNSITASSAPKDYGYIANNPKNIFMISLEIFK
jgi:hypothetical protein